MWINTRDRLPDKDGEYMMQSVYGSIGTILYTVDGGWNTHRTAAGLFMDNAISNNGYIARWFDIPEPEPVPEEWVDEYEEARNDG